MIKKYKLLEQVRQVIRSRDYSSQTEKAYLDWIYRFILYHHQKPPAAMGENEIAAFLTFLASERKVSAASQLQALQAVVFLYREVLHMQLDHFDFVHAKSDKSLPVVLSRQEVAQVLVHLKGEPWLMASLLYGCGMRLLECLTLRVKDINFILNEITICSGKENKDRSTLLPQLLKAHLQRQIEKTRIKWEENLLIVKFGGVTLPEVWERKYPDAPKTFGWQYIFPAQKLSPDSHPGECRQHHRHESYLQKAVKKAVQEANIHKAVSCQTLRHSFAAHLLEDGCDIHLVQKLLGHAHIGTTMIYKQVVSSNAKVTSPLDGL